MVILLRPWFRAITHTLGTWLCLQLAILYFRRLSCSKFSTAVYNVQSVWG